MVRAEAVDDQKHRHRLSPRRPLQLRHGLARRGEYPNSGIILALEPNKRIVTTDAINPATFEPAGPFMIAEVTFEDLGNGKTKYRAVARHWTEETKEQHKQMGFHEGWGQTARQLEALAKTI